MLPMKYMKCKNIAEAAHNVILVGGSPHIKYQDHSEPVSRVMTVIKSK